VSGAKEQVAAGQKALAAGNLPGAEAHFRAALAANPARGEAMTGLAQVALAVGNGAAALELALKGAQLSPRDAHAHYVAGEVLRLTGQLTEAASHYRQALDRQPRHFEAAGNLSSVLIALNRFAEAMAAAQAATRLKPQEAGGWINLATAALGAGDSAGALNAAAKALELLPDAPSTRHLYALGLRAAGRLQDALDTVRGTLAMIPDDKPTLLLGIEIAQRIKDGAQADSFSRAATSHHPQDGAVWIARARVLIDVPDEEGALAALDQARAAGASEVECTGLNISLAYRAGKVDVVEALAARCREIGGLSWEAAHICGLAARDRGNLAAAADFFRQALALNPQSAETESMLGMTLLTSGVLAEGWRHYNARLNVNLGTGSLARANLNAPVWTGTSLQPGQALLVWGEQGIGDELLFATMLDDLFGVLAAGRVILEVDPRLVPLFQRHFPLATVYPRAKTGPSPIDAQNIRYDYQCSFLQLAGFFRNGIAAFPRTLRPMVADAGVASQAAEWFGSLPPGRNVGIYWRSLIDSEERRPYYSTLADWSALSNCPGINLIALQYGDVTAEVEMARRAGGRVYVPPFDRRDDFEAIAAYCARLDCLVTHDTAGGAMGAWTAPQTLWLTTPHSWVTLGTEEYPWFPGAKLFLKAQSGWAEPINAAVNYIHQLLKV